MAAVGRVVFALHCSIRLPASSAVLRFLSAGCRDLLVCDPPSEQAFIDAAMQLAEADAGLAPAPAAPPPRKRRVSAAKAAAAKAQQEADARARTEQLEAAVAARREAASARWREAMAAHTRAFGSPGDVRGALRAHVHVRGGGGVLA
jgi:hypothetical protein